MVGDNFQYKLGPPDTGFSLFLAERTKKIHFIRHGVCVCVCVCGCVCVCVCVCVVCM